MDNGVIQSRLVRAFNLATPRLVPVSIRMKVDGQNRLRLFGFTLR